MRYLSILFSNGTVCLGGRVGCVVCALGAERVFVLILLLERFVFAIYAFPYRFDASNRSLGAAIKAGQSRQNGADILQSPYLFSQPRRMSIYQDLDTIADASILCMKYQGKIAFSHSTNPRKSLKAFNIPCSPTCH